MQRIGYAGAVLALLAWAPAGAQPMPTGQELVDRHVEAIGGRQKALSFTSRTLTYRIEMEAGVADVEIRMRRPNLGVSRMSTPIGEMRSGTDGTTTWAVTPQGGQVVTGARAEEVRARIAFDGDVLLDAYTQLETVGRAEYGGRPCWKVRMVTRGTGSVTHRCFDVETGLAIAAIQVQQGVEVTAVLEDYRDFDGIRFPTRSTATGGGRRVVTRLLGVSHAEVPLSAFAVPASVRR